MKQKNEEGSTSILRVIIIIKSCSPLRQLEMNFVSVQISSLLFVPPESSTLSLPSLGAAPRLGTKIDPGAACTFLAWLDE